MRNIVTMLAIALALGGRAGARAGAWDQAQKLQSSGKCDEAIRKADAMLSYGSQSPEEQARANLLKAQCYEVLEKHDQAAALYTYVVRTFPETAAAFQAAAAPTKYGSSEPPAAPEIDSQPL